MRRHGGFTELRREWDRSGRQRTEAMMHDVHRESTPATWGRSGQDFAALTVAALPPERFPRIVELGCGPGRVTHWLARRYEHVYAVDIAPVMLDHVEDGKRAGRIGRNVTTACSDGTALDADATGVYSSLVLMHNRRPDVRAIMAALRSVVGDSGRVAFQMPCYQYPVEPTSWRHVAQWTRAELEALAADTGFTAAEIHENPGRYVHGRPPGPHHFDLHIFDAR